MKQHINSRESNIIDIWARVGKHSWSLVSCTWRFEASFSWRWVPVVTVTVTIDGPRCSILPCTLSGSYPLKPHKGRASFFFIAPGRCIKGPMNFDLGLGHPGNVGHEQFLLFRGIRLRALELVNAWMYFILKKGFSLWVLVNWGNLFTGLSVLNEKCP